MKKFLIMTSLAVLLCFIGCGGGGDSASTPAKGEAKVVADFLDNIIKDGDLNAAFNLLSGDDKAMMGEMPGFYDFLTGKENENIDEQLLLMRALIDEITPIPSNIISYQVGDPIGEGENLTVPVTFSIPKEDFDAFVRENMDQELYERMDNLDEEDISFAEKKKVIAEAVKDLRAVVKGKTFEMNTSTQNITLVKESGSWKISLASIGLLNMFGF